MLSKKLIREPWDDTQMEVYFRRGLAEILGVAPSFFSDGAYHRLLEIVSRESFELSAGGAYLQNLLREDAYGAHFKNRLIAICTFVSAIEQLASEDVTNEQAGTSGGSLRAERGGQDNVSSGASETSAATGDGVEDKISGPADQKLSKRTRRQQGA